MDNDFFLLLTLDSLQAVDEDGELLGADMVLVLNTNGELEFKTRELTDLAPVTTVQKLLVLKFLTVDVLVEDFSHLLGSKVVQGVGLGRVVKSSNHGTGGRTAVKRRQTKKDRESGK